MRCRSFALVLAAAYQTEAASLSLSKNSAISGTGATLTRNLMGHYNPTNVGVLPAPYYWWKQVKCGVLCSTTGTILGMRNTMIKLLKP